MTRRTLPVVLAAATALTAMQARGVPVIPEESGWSGHVNIGAAVGTSESNMLAEIVGQDLGNDTVSSLDSGPDDEDIALPAVQFEVAYTIADMLMQLYVGNQVVDEVSFDLDTTLDTHAGVRQDLGEVGRIDFSISGTSLATDVWDDPYVVDSPRGNSERTSVGIHLAWDNIFTTPLEFGYSSNEIEIDDERSGENAALGLTGDEQRLLRREGQVKRLSLSYDWKINDRHRLMPGIGYVDRDLDGGAMAEDGPALQLQHLYTLNRWRVVSKLYYQELESDDVNPIYGDEREVDTLGGSVALFFIKPFGLEGWTANASASYYDVDANIDFYDSSFGLISVGMLYRFD